MPDRQLVEDIANRLNVAPALIEKDWYVVRALGALAGFDHGDIQPVFSGGTSLSIGWGLIKRFSEDIDFKVAMPDAPSRSAGKTQRSEYREAVFTAMRDAGFEISGVPLIGNESRFFSADFLYESEFKTGPGLRPHLRLEMSFQAPSLPAVARPLQSLISKSLKQQPEIAGFSCIDPIETAADKLSALAWRVCARQRGTEDDDPTIVRHIHDLAALEQHASSSNQFVALVRSIVQADSDRGQNVPKEPKERFARMLEHLTNDKLWKDEYEEFVQSVLICTQN